MPRCWRNSPARRPVSYINGAAHHHIRNRNPHPGAALGANGVCHCFGNFHLNQLHAVTVAIVCSGLVYLVERIVLATPKVWFVNVSRLVIGLVISILGASTVDLVIFDREIAEQLQRDGEFRLLAEYDAQIQERAKGMALKRMSG